jgi:hypothetical protein
MTAVERLVVKMARVRVPPHVRKVGGRLVAVDGYTYEREGAPAPLLDPDPGSPVMSRKKARHWARHSKIKTPVYRYSSKKNRKSIRRHGLVDRYNADQANYGAGIYVGMSKDSVERYDRSGTFRIEAYVDVRRVLEIGDKGQGVRDISREAGVKETGDPKKLQQRLLAAGYDAIRLQQIFGARGWENSEDDWLVVLDPRSIRVVEESL